MRILIITYFFPPYNTIGAVRLGKIAKYLTKFGHEVRVVTAKNQSLGLELQTSLELEIPSSNVLYTRWLDLSKLKPGFLKGQILSNGHVGWLPFALFTTNRLLRSWKPDLIFASAMPTVSLMVGYGVSVRHKIPFIAELRDLWIDDFIVKYSPKRRIVEESLERKVLSHATSVITVSPPLAEILRKKYNKEIDVVYNGFDQEDYEQTHEIKYPKEDALSIVYTGTLYENYRDPSPLFEAMHILDTQKDQICVKFFGEDGDKVIELAKRFGVEQSVKTSFRVPYRDSTRIQRKSDILLLLLWLDPRARGMYTGKLFEYIGARRPILAIGHPDNDVADLIRERNLGFVSLDPKEISERLQLWIAEKRQGKLTDLPHEVTRGFTREEQVRRLENIFQGVVSKCSIDSPAIL
jgi:glycosyltransferase involved in cell wall biosynthesis